MAMEAGWRALQFTTKAIDAYMKTLLVDKVTTDEEKPAPVYLLDELSEILRSSSIDLIQEIVEYTFRRLRHRSPLVKTKVLRFIKYTVARAGPQYKKELQQHGYLIEELFTFRGTVDPIKGNSINLAVQDVAREAFNTIFSANTSHSTCESTRGRIEGFGSGSFSCSSIGSESSFSREDNIDATNGSKENSRFVIHKQDSQCRKENMNHRFSNEHFNHKIFLEQNMNVVPLNDKVVTNAVSHAGQAQPTYEHLQSFMSNAQLAGVLKFNLQSPSWQERLNAACLLEAILYQNDDSLVKTLQAEEMSIQCSLKDCVLSPQAVLREKAKQVIDLLSALKNKKKSVESSSPFFTIDVVQEVDTNSSALSPSSVHIPSLKDVIELRPQIEDRLKLQITKKDTVADDPFHGMCAGDSYESSVVDTDLLGGLTECHHIEETHTNLDLKSTTHGLNNMETETKRMQSSLSDFTMQYSVSTQMIFESNSPLYRKLKDDGNNSCTDTYGSLQTNLSPGGVEGFYDGIDVIAYNKKNAGGSRPMLNVHHQGFGCTSIAAGLLHHEGNFDFISEYLHTNWGFKTLKEKS